MLRDLYIRNLAVVEEATIELGPGFNVLSGETGAGKSIVVDSLALLAGVRASNDQIRTGAETLTVSGRFEPAGDGWQRVLDDAGIEPEDGAVVVRREVSRSGRNRVFVNDRPVTLRLLADLGPFLLRIHGQREELGLVAPELQRTWLDLVGGDEAAALLDRTAQAFADYRRLAERLEHLTGDQRTRHERIDFLRFQLSEIDAAEVEAGEETALGEERGVLRHSEAIQAALAEAAAELYDDDGAADRLARAVQALGRAGEWEPRAAEWASELDEIAIRVTELDAPLRRRLEQVESDPGRLNAIEERLATLERLFRKHGKGTREVLERRAEMVAELTELEGDAGSLAELEEQVAEALDVYRDAALELSAGRRRWARRLERAVEEQLPELALEKARFAVEIESRRRAASPLAVAGEPVEISVHGVDRVTFAFSPNPGEELRPLAKVASGGELSRLYLAVQLAARGGGRRLAPLSLVFDEVDSGLSGAEAAVLGAKLRRLADGGQVLAVTHLPQVASCADLHFKVAKQVRGGRTRTRVERLAERERVEEVARMLAGSEVTETSRSHARELIVGAGVS